MYPKKPLIEFHRDAVDLTLWPEALSFGSLMRSLSLSNVPECADMKCKKRYQIWIISSTFPPSKQIDILQSMDQDMAMIQFTKDMLVYKYTLYTNKFIFDLFCLRTQNISHFKKVLITLTNCAQIIKIIQPACEIMISATMNHHS